ncbi:MAG: hypothetical protein ACREL1_01030 [bacterium]
MTLRVGLPMAASWLKVEVFTVAFRKVNEISWMNVRPGITDVAIPLTDKRGSPLANGLYYVFARTTSERFITKLLILR